MTENLLSSLADLTDSLKPLATLGEATKQIEAVQDLQERIETRRTLAPTTLVVALAGTTGAGKSSLFNSLAGADLSQVGVLRPTTSSPVAAIFGSPESGVGKLLDWLDVKDRSSVPAFGAEDERLVLIDLPDIDSITASNREVAERYLAVVDVIVWVVDPEKYADSRVHDEYLRPFASLAPVMDIVINQVDRLTESETAAAVADLRHRLRAAGINSEVLPTAVRTGAGVEALRARLRERAAARKDQVARLELDARTTAEELGRSHPFTKRDQARTESAITAFEQEVPEIVGARQFAAAASGEYRHLLRRRTAWPPLRIIHNSRPYPPRSELHTDHLSQPVGRLLVGLEGTGGWHRVLRKEVADERLSNQLRAYRPEALSITPPRWTRAASALGWFSILLVVAAVAMFGIEIAVRYFGFSLPPALDPVPADPPYPALPALPWSAAVGAIAVIVTVLISAGVAIARRVSAGRFRARVFRRVSGDVTRIVTEIVTDPLREQVRSAAKYRDALMKITQSG